MSRVYFNAFLLLLILGLSHVLVWRMDQGLYRAQVNRQEEIKKMHYPSLKKERLTLKALQEKSLNEYRWIKERNGHVQIPIDRAFDYYLRDHK